jgi:large subunit ribosomal protein L23
MSKEMKHRFVSSEKSFLVREQNKIILLTSDWISKEEVKVFIEEKYDTKVLKINSLITMGKTKVRRRIKATLPNKKKFYITVDNFDKFEKVEQDNAKAV